MHVFVAGDEGRRGGMGGGVGRWPMEGGQRGEMGGGHQRAVWEQQKVHWFPFWAPLTTGLIWLVTRVGGWGGGVGRWPMEGGEGGEMGGGTREQCGSKKKVRLLGNWYDLAGDEGGR